MKKVQVNTPLILEQNGELVRIEAGAVIDLPDDVYSEVSAHTTLLDDEMSDEPVFEPEPMPEIQDEPTLGEVITELEETSNGDTLSDEVTTTETAQLRKSTRKKA